MFLNISKEIVNIIVMEFRKDKPEGQSVDIYRVVTKPPAHFKEDEG